jgi:hypothetical protein
LNLEHHRKDAKRLVRAVRAAAPGALARVTAVLGDRAGERFLLSDALHVIAREHGYGSWPELKRVVEQTQELPGDPDRIELAVDTGLEYRPGDRVLVRVVRRGPRTWISDDGVAFARAGRPGGWRKAAARVEQELVVNFSRSAVISLPVVRVGPPEERIVQRIGEASRAFYQELLELS